MLYNQTDSQSSINFLQGRVTLTLSLILFCSFLSAQNLHKSTNKWKYQEQTVQSGKHSTKLNQRYWLPVKTKDFDLYSWMYGPGVRYNLGDSDQLDWNKFAGVFGDKYRPHGKTTMLVFRYNVSLDSMEWTFYHHSIKNKSDYKPVGGVPGYIKPENILRTAPGYVPVWKVDFKGRKQINLAMVYQNQIRTDTIYFDSKIDKRHTRGNLYFGGNRTAPAKIEAQKSYREFKPLKQFKGNHKKRA